MGTAPSKLDMPNSMKLADRLRKEARRARKTMVVSRSGAKADGYVLLTCDEAVAIADLITEVAHEATRKL